MPPPARKTSTPMSGQAPTSSTFHSSLTTAQHQKQASTRNTTKPVQYAGPSAMDEAAQAAQQAQTPTQSKAPALLGSPTAAEEGASVQETASPEHGDKQQSAASTAPELEFTEELSVGLSGQGLEGSSANPSTRHGLTFDELIRPLIDPHLPPARGMEKITQMMLQELESTSDEEDPDLPSLMMRPPVTEYMRQFERAAEEEMDRELYRS